MRYQFFEDRDGDSALVIFQSDFFEILALDNSSSFIFFSKHLLLCFLHQLLFHEFPFCQKEADSFAHVNYLISEITDDFQFEHIIKSYSMLLLASQALNFSATTSMQCEQGLLHNM